MEFLSHFDNIISKTFWYLRYRIANYFEVKPNFDVEVLRAILKIEKKKSSDYNEYCKELEKSINRMSKRNVELSNINREIRDLVTEMEPGSDKLKLERVLNLVPNPLKKQ